MRLATLTVALVLAAAATAQAQADRPALTISHAGQEADATLGSFCAGGLCQDSLHPPRPTERLDVGGGDRVTLRFNMRAQHVEVHMLRIRADGSGRTGRELTAHRVTGKRWRVRLPQRLRRANGLDVFARGAGWDAGFWGGLHRTG